MNTEVMRRIKRKEEFSWWGKGCSKEKQGLSDLVGPPVCESTRADVDFDSDMPNVQEECEVGLLANLPVASGLQDDATVESNASVEE